MADYTPEMADYTPEVAAGGPQAWGPRTQTTPLKWPRAAGKPVQIEGLKSHINADSNFIVNQHFFQELYACKNSKPQGLEEH